MARVSSGGLLALQAVRVVPAEAEMTEFEEFLKIALSWEGVSKEERRSQAEMFIEMNDPRAVQAIVDWAEELR